MMPRSGIRLALVGLMLSMLGACASTGPTGGAGAGERLARDPFERVNRAVFAFNEVIDDWLTRPVAQAYVEVVPEPMRVMVSGVLGNIAEPWSAFNQALQGKPDQAGSDLMRFMVNTTFGLGGLLDFATPMGFEKQREDFGQTLGRWGMPAGPYLVLPMLGPASVRDFAGTVAFMVANPVLQSAEQSTRTVYTITNIVDTRAALLPADRLIREAALDRYGFIRDGYLQRRHNQVWDGNPPQPKE